MKDATSLFIKAWRVLNSGFDSATFEDRDGVVSCFGHVPVLFFNLSFALHPAADQEAFRDQLRTVASREAGCAHPTALVLEEAGLPGGWESILATQSRVPLMPLLAMETEELLAPRRSAPPELEIRRVSNPRIARHFAGINAHAYQMPPELFDCMADKRFWSDDQLAFVGYVNGEPVSTAAALPAAGTVYIAMVATMPGSQGRGYAENVMRRAVTEGQRAMGVRRTTLHASEAGSKVYAAMGYRAGPRMLLVGRA